MDPSCILILHPKGGVTQTVQTVHPPKIHLYMEEVHLRSSINRPHDIAPASLSQPVQPAKRQTKSLRLIYKHECQTGASLGVDL